MKKFRYISIFLVLIVCASAKAIEIASKRYPIEVDGLTTYLPYESSHDLFVKNASITRLIYSIHSASYSAKAYFDNAIALVNKVPKEKDKTLVIAPHILPKGCLENPEQSDILYWEFPAFWGTSRGMFNGKRVRISSYEVTDRILEEVVAGGNFPNLETMIILGHSAGGQMVNRYAASGLFENKIAKLKGIEVRYLVMGPSSYLYFNEERVVEGTRNKFSVPENVPENYNNWGYGLGTMFTFHKKFEITPERIIKQYPSKRVMYLVGSKDRDENESSLDKKPPAMLQGRHRLERGIIYYNYLVHFFGEKIKETQHFRVVRGVGHSGRTLMLSRQSVRFTLASDFKGDVLQK